MNVMVYNKFKELLKGINIEVMKSLEGVYNVDEIIDTFTNFYYDKMILDITAIRDYQNADNLQKLAMNINMENVIVLLDDTPETNDEKYIAKLVSLGIYNFTKDANGINYLLVHPHTYKDVVNVRSLDQAGAPQVVGTTPIDVNKTAQSAPVEAAVVKEEKPEEVALNNGRMRIIGFKDVTNHAGATSLIYMLKKHLQNIKRVVAIEVNRVDFLYYNDKDMLSSTTQDLAKDIMNRNTYDVILVDLNDYEDLSVCSEVFYLVEPSTLMINKLLKKNKSILDVLKGQKIVLNKCCLNDKDIATFEYETKLSIIASIPCVNDREDQIEAISNFIKKVNM